jgi:hypothetical protein
MHAYSAGLEFATAALAAAGYRPARGMSTTAERTIISPTSSVRLKRDRAEYLVLETKGFDELAEIKGAAAQRWVAAVNADGQFGTWRFAMARSVAAVRDILDALAVAPAAG